MNIRTRKKNSRGKYAKYLTKMTDLQTVWKANREGTFYTMMGSPFRRLGAMIEHTLSPDGSAIIKVLPKYIS